MVNSDLVSLVHRCRSRNSSNGRQLIRRRCVEPPLSSAAGCLGQTEHGRGAGRRSNRRTRASREHPRHSRAEQLRALGGSLRAEVFHATRSRAPSRELPSAAPRVGKSGVTLVAFRQITRLQVVTSDGDAPGSARRHHPPRHLLEKSPARVNVPLRCCATPGRSRTLEVAGIDNSSLPPTIIVPYREPTILYMTVRGKISN